MEYLKHLNVVISFASLAVVAVAAWQLRRTQFAISRALAALVTVFALRSITRVLPPFGEDSPVVIGIVDTIMLAAMVVLVLDGRRIVRGFVAQREAAETAQIEYDLALHSLDHGVTQGLDQRLAALQDAAEAAAGAGPGAAPEQVLRSIASELDAIRSGGDPRSS